MVDAQIETVITRFQVLWRNHAATLKPDDELNIGCVKWNNFFWRRKSWLTHNIFCKPLFKGSFLLHSLPLSVHIFADGSLHIVVSVLSAIVVGD